MKILNHKLEGCDFKAARWIGPAITPAIVVLHDTASHLTKGNAAAYLRDNNAQVSVHFVIERDGSITQLVPTNRRANHAGQSSFQGRSGCNDFSIGIELEGNLSDPFTDAQYRVLTALLAALPQRHPQLAAITGHEHVAPGRKTDPGPMFDWLRLARATSLPCILPSLR